MQRSSHVRRDAVIGLVAVAALVAAVFASGPEPDTGANADSGSLWPAAAGSRAGTATHRQG